MTNEDVIRFLKKNPALTISGIEKEAGLPSSTLSRAMSGSRKLTAKHLESLLPVVKKYGYLETEGAYIISIANHKGGVAKTTTTANLGAALHQLGKKVLLIDMDQQGNLSQHFGLDNPETQLYHALSFQTNPKREIQECVYEIREGFHLIPSDIELSAATIELPTQQLKGYQRLKQIIQPIVLNYDYILIDCPPSLDILTCSAIVASNSLLITVQPEDSSVKGLGNLFSIYEDMKMLNAGISIEGILFTLVDRTTIHSAYMKDVREHYSQLRVFDAFIRRNVTLTEAKTASMDVIEFDPKSNGAQDYMDLAKELVVE